MTDNLTAALSSLIPLFSYHDRWDELTKQDFSAFFQEVKAYTRGYNFDTSMQMNGTTTYGEEITDHFSVPTYAVDEDAEELQLDTEGLYYLKKMISFCEEKDLTLVLVMMPRTTGWSDLHNAVQTIADDNGLDFIDFNFSPYIDEIDYNVATDSVDGTHCNYYGAHKLTAWFGDYLTQTCGNTDRRGDSDYAYMDEQVQQFHAYTAKVTYGSECLDVATYLTRAASDENHIVFITVKDEGSSALGDNERTVFSQLGLTQLAALGWRDSYIGMIKDGIVVYDALDKYVEEETSETTETTVKNDMENIEELYDSEREAEKEEEETEEETFRLKSVLTSREKFELTSSTDTASCKIDGTEYSVNSRGINIVVWDEEIGEVVDSVCFDTYATTVRDPVYYGDALAQKLEAGVAYEDLSSKLQGLYRFNERCREAKEEAESGGVE